MRGCVGSCSGSTPVQATIAVEKAATQIERLHVLVQAELRSLARDLDFETCAGLLFPQNGSRFDVGVVEGDEAGVLKTQNSSQGSRNQGSYGDRA